MIFNASLLRGMLWWIFGGAIASTTFGQTTLKVAPVPRDPHEPVMSQIQVASTPASRQAALQLLARARRSFALRSAGLPYDLKVSFTVASQGETNYDGAWTMEDFFSPRVGHRWTATAASGYTITSISAAGKTYGEGTSSVVPLRLLDARGVLFDPIQSPAFADRGSIRTSTASLDGKPVTCLLLSRTQSAGVPAPGRAWEETEECIDPQSGLLQLHSEVPGHYAAYEYANGPQLGDRVLPRSVTITEAGRVVSKISVESLQTNAALDASLFVPTDAMKAAGQAIAMTSATKVARISGQGPLAPAMTIQPVCIFGMVTPTGQLVEAHSLQPSDPNSQAALEDAKQIDFSPTIPAAAAPRQHFVFVIEKFLSQP